jgi:thiol-disulfide isomerase/thioredoxin
MESYRIARYTLAAALFLGAAHAQPSKGTPGAKAKLDEARAALKDKDEAKAEAAFRAAIELDPNFLDAHEAFVRAVNAAERDKVKDVPEAQKQAANQKASDDADRKLDAIYQEWVKRYPSKAAFPYMLGDMYMYTDYDKVERYTLQAIKVDPQFTPAYQSMALIEEVRGNTAKRLDYLKHAADVDPTDDAAAFYYANAQRDVDPALYRKLAEAVATRFPNSERGAQALYWLAHDTTDLSGKIEILERCKSTFPPDKFGWSSDAMDLLFDAYGKTDSAKTLALADEMTHHASREDATTWGKILTYQKRLVLARTSLDEGTEKSTLVAIRLLEDLLADKLLPRYLDSTPAYLLMAEATAARGGPQPAYDALLKPMAELPGDDLYQAILQYGAMLNKTPTEVEADIRTLLEAHGSTPAPFTLPHYGDEHPTSLSDYRGKVVLLNFWYPFCGPCRGEAPYLQKVLEKYGPRGFVILSLNVHPAEDQFVLPYLESYGYGFIPLRASQEFAEKQYSARGMPANFLIDREGRILYKPRVISGSYAQRSLELQVETLLAPKENSSPVDAGAVLDPASLPAGGKGRFQIVLRLADGAHVNSHAPADPHLIGTTFTPEPAAGIVWGAPEYPPVSSVTEWYATDPLSVYQDGAVITVPFTVSPSASPKPVALGGALRAQACDHEKCYPPRSIPLSAQLTISGK